jgi:hypothetical protein
MFRRGVLSVTDQGDSDILRSTNPEAQRRRALRVS